MYISPTLYSSLSSLENISINVQSFKLYSYFNNDHKLMMCGHVSIYLEENKHMLQ